MSFTFTTSGAVKLAAGTDANTSAITGAQYEDWSDKVESIICDIIHYDAITNYSGLTANGKEILGDLEDAMIAQKLINYDVLAIGTNTAQFMLDILENQIQRNIDLLKDGKIRTYLNSE